MRMAIPTRPLRLALVGLALWAASSLPPAAMATDTPASTAPPPAVAGTPTPNAPAPMTDIHDIRPPVPVGFDFPWRIAALLALAAAVLLALRWWWYRRRTPKTITSIVPELPPEMVALQALDRINDVRGRDAKAFYFQLSAILRLYVSGRFRIGAPEMTTEEFIPCIDRLAIDRELARQLKQVCRGMDPVKFAGVGVTEKQMQNDLFFVRGFVRQTTPAAGVLEDANAGEPLDDVQRIEKIPISK